MIGAAILGALGLQVMFTTGRSRLGRPLYAVSSARIRAAGWLALATALLLAGADALLAAGLLMFAAVGVMCVAVVVAVQGQRAARREAEQG